MMLSPAKTARGNQKQKKVTSPSTSRSHVPVQDITQDHHLFSAGSQHKFVMNDTVRDNHYSGAECLHGYLNFKPVLSAETSAMIGLNCPFLSISSQCSKIC